MTRDTKRLYSLGKGKGATGEGEEAPAQERPPIFDVGAASRKKDAAATLDPADEPTVSEALADGADLVTFSGDKLLGGPQAGILAGRGDLLARVRRHPLMRVLRVDKLAYAALEGTLAEYAAGRASRTIPILRMILDAPEAIEARARVLAARAEAGGVLEAEVAAGRSKVGGGTTPGVELPTFVLALRHRQRSVDWLDEWLRRREPGIVGRIENDRLLLDLRTVLADEDAIVSEALAAVPA